MARKIMNVSYVYAEDMKLIGFILTDTDSGEAKKAYALGDKFTIGNQMRSWTVVSDGATISCEKYSNDGRVMESFRVPEYQTVLWATSSGSARNGVCHRYRGEDAFHAHWRKKGCPTYIADAESLQEVNISKMAELCKVPAAADESEWHNWKKWCLCLYTDGTIDWDGAIPTIRTATYIVVARDGEDEEDKFLGGVYTAEAKALY